MRERVHTVVAVDNCLTCDVSVYLTKFWHGIALHGLSAVVKPTVVIVSGAVTVALDAL